MLIYVTDGHLAVTRLTLKVLEQTFRGFITN